MQLIRTAGLVRQLLLENLYDLVNKKYQIRLQFDIAVSDVKPTPRAYSFHNIESGEKRKIVDKTEFFKTPIVIYDLSKTYSIKDILTYAANVNGGIHASPNPRKEHKKIQQLYAVFEPMNYPFEFIALSQVCPLVVEALEPLDKYKKSRKTLIPHTT